MKNEFETTLKAFGKYIEGQNDFYIVCSKKVGYLTNYLDYLDSFMNAYQKRYIKDGEKVAG